MNIVDQIIASLNEKPERRKSWKNEYALGRVFELRSSAKDRDAPCVLIVKEQDGMWPENHTGCQIDELGTRKHPYDARDSRRAARALSDHYRWNKSMMTSKRIARRRPDLEKFNETDLALIQYGYSLLFTRYMPGNWRWRLLPVIEGLSWTIFETGDWYQRLHGNADDYKAAMSILHGDYHLQSAGRDKAEGWATAVDDETRLAEFEQRMKAIMPDLTRRKVSIVRKPTSNDFHLLEEWSEPLGNVFTSYPHYVNKTAAQSATGKGG